MLMRTGFARLLPLTVLTGMVTIGVAVARHTTSRPAPTQRQQGAAGPSRSSPHYPNVEIEDADGLRPPIPFLVEGSPGDRPRPGDRSPTTFITYSGPHMLRRVPRELLPYVLQPADLPGFRPQQQLAACRDETSLGTRLSLGYSLRRARDLPGREPAGGPGELDVYAHLLQSARAAIVQVEQWKDPGNRQVPVDWRPGAATAAVLSADEVSSARLGRSHYVLLLRRATLVLQLEFDAYDGVGRDWPRDWEISGQEIAFVDALAERLLLREPAEAAASAMPGDGSPC